MAMIFKGHGYSLMIHTNHAAVARTANRMTHDFQVRNDKHQYHFTAFDVIKNPHTIFIKVDVTRKEGGKTNVFTAVRVFPAVREFPNMVADAVSFAAKFIGSRAPAQLQDDAEWMDFPKVDPVLGGWLPAIEKERTYVLAVMEALQQEVMTMPANLQIKRKPA